jgi:DNA-binding beta-propeller fold protein YncE
MVRRQKGRLVTRRQFSAAALASIAVVSSGCLGSRGPQTGRLEKVWGLVGATPGRLFRPRAVAIDKGDLLYIVDMTPQIQVFTGEGEFVRGWQTPDFKNGRPSGLSFDNAGNLLVSDTHYYRVLVYTPRGELIENQTIGGKCGDGNGEFRFVTDAVQDKDGSYYVAQYGEYDRIQKFSAERRFLLSWGDHGEEPGQFSRPQKLAIDKTGLIWVTDSCNHRIQVFDGNAGGAEAKQANVIAVKNVAPHPSPLPKGEGTVGPPVLVKMWGEQGQQAGQLSYPYDILLDEAALAGDAGGFVYVCEFGNHRVQKFTRNGEFVGSFGHNGRREGELDQPWGIARDSQGRMYVLDTYNHRVQRFRL